MRETLTPEEMKLAFTFLLTMPGCPFLYYGDEIGMRYVHGLKSKEGGYERTGSRTPMQWDRSRNAGFSEGRSADLYLPIDPDPERPNWEEQKKDPRSLWTHVQNMIRFRMAHSALQSAAEFRFLTDGRGYPLVYERWDGTEHLLIALNPSAEPAVWAGETGRAGTELLYSCRGARIEADGSLLLPPGSCAVLSE
jgi:maltose alpha-D-glucosyltransferase/alpha-amylase